MSDSAFYHAALALAAGMVAQAVAARVAVPSIVLLLVGGALVGPDVLGLLDPTVFGSGRADLVSLAVTVILFEGGLALDFHRLRQQQRSLLLLLTLGGAISMLVGLLAARFVLGFPWPIAALYGSIMIVTGPTVVTPLLSRLTVARPVRELLVSEGVLIDPIGAIVAIVTVDYVVGRLPVLESGWHIVEGLGVGAALGVAGGLAFAAILKRQWIAEELVNPAALGAALVAAALASRLSAEAGLMAAVAQGAVLANARLRELQRLREFKEALTVILLSFLFVVLAADLRLREVYALGWGGVAVVALLAWVARPLAVLLATLGSSLSLRQRLFVAWICPRGIVAAAVAGLFRLLLIDEGIAGGSRLEALVFVTVALTVTVQGLTARPIARLLGVDHPTAVGTIVVGADHLGRLLARLLVALERQVVVLDRARNLCRTARAEGLSVYEGDALSIDVLEETGARYADTVVATTRNLELNALIAHRVRETFRVDRVVVLHDDPTDADSGPRPGLFPGDFTGADEVNRLLRLRKLRVVQYPPIEPGEAVGQTLAELPYGDGEFALLFRRGTGTIVAAGSEKLAARDELWCAKPAGPSPLVELLGVPHETDARKPTPRRPEPTTAP